MEKAVSIRGKFARLMKSSHRPFLKLKKQRKLYWLLTKPSPRGLGVVSLGLKMIDAPVVKRAAQVIDLAVISGLLSKDWKIHE